MVRLIKSEKVLIPLYAGDEGAFYGFIDDDTGAEKIVLCLSKQDVEDFGSPEKLTITVVPGDLLND